ncbi:hypothetical protein HY086_05105 [Candidatus Gottesmanbacteria bacterium]|nr:hypothetical protein [Candidatus Gottesmanbacteria bacterium]
MAAPALEKLAPPPQKEAVVPPVAAGAKKTTGEAPPNTPRAELTNRTLFERIRSLVRSDKPDLKSIEDESKEPATILKEMTALLHLLKDTRMIMTALDRYAGDNDIGREVQADLRDMIINRFGKIEVKGKEAKAALEMFNVLRNQLQTKDPGKAIPFKDSQLAKALVKNTKTVPNLPEVLAALEGGTMTVTEVARLILMSNQPKMEGLAQAFWNAYRGQQENPPMLNAPGGLLSFAGIPQTHETHAEARQSLDKHRAGISKISMAFGVAIGLQVLAMFFTEAEGKQGGGGHQ